jgi:RNA polymerase sigma factor (sigma-70 family)
MMNLGKEPPMTPTDEEAMWAVGQGDLDQAGLLFERYHARLCHFLLRMVADRDASQDLAQNVFMRLLRYRASYRQGQPFRAWLYQIARNVANDHFEKQKTRFVGLKAAHEQLAAPDGTDRAEQVAALQFALQHLPESDREVLVLSRYEDLKYEEIAQIMGISPGAVKVKVHRAIKKLKDIYFQPENQNQA